MPTAVKVARPYTCTHTRFDVGLAVRDRLKWFFHLQAQGMRNKNNNNNNNKQTISKAP